MKNVLFFIFLLFTFSTLAQELKCSDLRTGTFKYANKQLKDIITRTDSTQVEISPIDNAEIHSSIEWTSDCEYILTYKKILNWKDDVSDVIGKKLFCKILDIKGDRIKMYVKGAYADGEVVLIRISEKP